MLTVYGGVHVRQRIFRGVRVLQPSAENLRAPPLDVFDTFPKLYFNNYLYAQFLESMPRNMYLDLFLSFDRLMILFYSFKVFLDLCQS